MRTFNPCFGLVPLVVALAACGSPLPIGGDSGTDASAMDARPADAVTECILPNDRRCPVGATCELSRCPDGTPLTCFCEASGAPRCNGVCPGSDGGADVTPRPDVTPPDVVVTDVTRVDVVPVEDVPSPDGGVVCTLPGGVRCPAGMTCEYARCPGGSPLSCFCDATGVARCTGVCPPTDASVDVPSMPDAGRCGAQDIRGVGPCATVVGYAWNGATCAAVSGCSCGGADCPAIFTSQSACMAAYASCPPAPADCRTTGCPAGRHCDACRGPSGLIYACIPDGAAC